MASGPWTDEENDLIVADYFAMLADDIAGRRYSKAEHRRALLPLLNERSEGSVEFKHQNISAVLKGLGEDWIPGYKPAFNFQMTLVDAVARWLDLHPDWLGRLPGTLPATGMREAAQIWIGPPPTLSNQPPPQELDQMLHIARKFDVAGRDERNRALGRAGDAPCAAPFLRHAHAAGDGRRPDPTQRVVFMKAAQVGATEAGNNWVGFVMHHAPGPMLAVQPTVELAKRNSRQRIDPLIEESPALRERVRPARARDSGNTQLSKDFPGGVLVMTGANSAVGLRSMPARYVFLDEVDAYPASADEEGDPVGLAEARSLNSSRPAGIG